MDSLFIFKDCFGGVPHRVFVHAVINDYFDQPKELLEKWLQNAGHTVIREMSECTFQICIKQCEPIANVPLIVVSTEQPLGHYFQEYFATSKSLYQSAQWIWCMDNVDYNYVQTWFEIPSEKLRIVPLMFGTFYDPGYALCDISTLGLAPDIDVLQFGWKHERRMNIMEELAVRKPEAMIVFTDTLFDVNEQRQMLSRTKLVVVPHGFEQPVTFGLHRLAFLLHFPHLIIVIEDAAPSMYMRQTLKWFDRFIIVPYDRIVDACVLALQSHKPNDMNASMYTDDKVDRFATRLLNWKGDVPWLNFLTP